MKKFFRIASIFLILASFIGCPSPEIGKNPGEEQKTGSIVGKVVYENENVKDYSGIQVSLISTNGLMAVDYCESRGISTNARKVEDIIFTDSKGNYNFKDVPEGVYTICASSDNSTKKAVLTNVTVTAGRTVTASDLGLTATGSITGKITIDGSTDGVLGLDVFIAGTSFVAKVGSDGNYEISNIPAKKGYILCVQKEKYTTTIEDNLEVKGNDTVKIKDVDLSSKDWEEDTVEQENPTFEWKGASESAPENPEIYWAYYNTKDGCSYIWNGSSWDLLAQAGTDGKDGVDGISITWKGALESAPENPGIYWAYYNTKDGRSYIWNGSKWEIISQDGIDGEDGVDGVDGINGVNGLSIIWKGVSSVAPENPELNWVYFNSEDGCSYIWNGNSWDLLAQAGKDGVNGDGSSFKGIYNTIENVIPKNVTLARNPYAENYQVDIPLPYSEILPETGDKVTLKWEFTSDIDIKNLRVSLADCSELVNTWKDLTVDYITETVTKDEVISLEKTLEISSKPIGNLTLIIRYNVVDTDVEATIKTTSSSIYLQRGDDSQVDISAKQITCVATEDGIKFTGNLLSNIISNIGGVTAVCEIQIIDTNNQITMVRNYSLSSDTWENWETIYPLVEKDKEYNFQVLILDGATTICDKKFTVIATGGLGEYTVTNSTDCEVTLEDKTLLTRTPQEFTNNTNLQNFLIDYGTKYVVYSCPEEATSIWDGMWCHDTIYWKQVKNQICDLTKLGWPSYPELENKLIGRKLGIETMTILKIAGYTYNNTAVFRMNDKKETFFDWDDEEPNQYFVMYRNPKTNECFSDVPGTSLYYILNEFDEDGNVVFVDKNTEGAIPVYGKLINYGDKIYEPMYAPKIEHYTFTGDWKVLVGVNLVERYPEFPFNSNDLGYCKKCVPIVFEPIITLLDATAKFISENGTEICDPIVKQNDGSGSYDWLNIQLPAIPEKEGFSAKWQDESGNTYYAGDYVELYNITCTFTAVYELPETRTAYFYDEDGEQIEFITVTENEYNSDWNLIQLPSFSNLEIPEGYIAKWQDESGNTYSAGDYVKLHNITWAFTAKYELPPTRTAYFYDEDGAQINESITVTENEYNSDWNLIQLPSFSNLEIPYGYIAKWQDESGNTYYAGECVKLHNITCAFTAKYELPPTRTAYFYDEDGAQINESITVTETEYISAWNQILLPEIPQKDGYSHCFWYDAEGTAYNQNSYINLIESETRYTAKYIDIEPEIITDSDFHIGNLSNGLPICIYKFACEENSSYKVYWVDSFEGKETLMNLLNEEGLENQICCDVKVSVYSENKTHIVCEQEDSGYASPTSFTANNSGYYFIEILPYSDDPNSRGYFAVKLN